MIVLRFIVNALIMVAEMALIAAAAYAGYHHPVIFACVTAILTFGLGLSLEYSRLRHELPYYFERKLSGSSLIARAVSLVDAMVKGLLAGVMALLTFSGTDQDRLFWVAIVFGVTVWIGTSVLRRLSISLDAHPSRWGYFRLAAPLGLLFSLALSFMPTPSFADIGYSVIFNLPEQPNIAQASEILFILKQKFDALIVLLLSGFLNADLARVVAALVSVNVLSGFVIGIYAMVIAEAVRWAEHKNG